MGNVVPFRTASRDEKLAAFGLAIEHNAPWFTKAIREVRRIKSGWRGTGEDLRLQLRERVGSPRHHNAWGTLVRQCITKGILVEADEPMRPMQTRKSHNRKTQVLQRP